MLISVKMAGEKLKEETRKHILSAQKEEISEHVIYRKLAQSAKDPQNKEVLHRISRDEKEHYDFWKEYTQKEVQPSTLKIWLYVLLSKIFGLIFSIKLMERRERGAQEIYEEIAEEVPSAREIVADEDEHEEELVNMIEEVRLRYIGSIVRGLNDALVELTGALAGLTFILHDTLLIGVTGLITGIAASLSMGGSEYLAFKSQETLKNPTNAAFYTGFSYILTVFLLIIPYFLLPNVYFSLIFMILNAVLIISFITFYISVTQEIAYGKRFGEMVLISLGIAGLTFVVGFIIRTSFGV